MLRNISSTALIVVMLVVLVAGNAQAQSANVSVGATVAAALSISKTADVAFGNLSATTAGQVYLSPTGTGSTYVGVTAAVGALHIGGAGSTSIRLGWPTTVTLTGPAALTYTLKVNGLNANTQASSGTLTLSGGYVSVTTGAGGAYYLWVGGDLGTLSGQTAGSYTGSAAFTVEYN